MDKKKRISIIIFIIGLAALIGGGVFFALDFFKKPDIRDADFIVSVGTWVKQDEPSVIWNFTEIGKGSLTTNNHLNDYNFIWAIDNDTLKIETSWLYDLENEYTFELDQNAKTLKLTSGEDIYTFIEKTNPEVPEEEPNEPATEDEPVEESTEE